MRDFLYSESHKLSSDEIMGKIFKKSKKEENEQNVESKEKIESISIDISKQTYKELTRIKEKNDCNNFDDVINGIIESLKDYQDNSENKGSDEKDGYRRTKTSENIIP